MNRLNHIQQKLKAPKGQRNDFGRYNYRSCEDIVEAVKPHLGDASLTLSDEMVAVGGRVYVKATATLFNGQDVLATAQGWAREAETKKGMDDSQITGAASSYARKYALNGLFAIDDTKDADATNDHGKGEAKKLAPKKSVKNDAEFKKTELRKEYDKASKAGDSKRMEDILKEVKELG